MGWMAGLRVGEDVTFIPGGGWERPGDITTPALSMSS